MKPRERVEMALNLEKPDRCPLQFGFTPEFRSRLKKDLEGKGKLPAEQDNYEFSCALGQDVLLASVGWANSYYMDNEPYVDEWGVGWEVYSYETPYGSGHYTEIASNPLSDDVLIDLYQPPDPDRPALYKQAEQLVRDYKSDYWIGGVVVTTIFETAWALRGLEQLMLDMVLDPDLTNRILDIPLNYHLSAAKKLTELGVDMIWIGDDVGSQHKMMISPKTWRKYLKPRMATFIQELKEINPEIKVAYHSDGHIEPIIPELIEIGLDILNPIQPASMDPARIKKMYGDKLCFWGTIDEQHTLPFGTPHDVVNEVKLRLETVGYNGGLILAPTHSIQLDTPLENFWAMVNTITNPSLT